MESSFRVKLCLAPPAAAAAAVAWFYETSLISGLAVPAIIPIRFLNFDRNDWCVFFFLLDWTSRQHPVTFWSVEHYKQVERYTASRLYCNSGNYFQLFCSKRVHPSSNEQYYFFSIPMKIQQKGWRRRQLQIWISLLLKTIPTRIQFAWIHSALNKTSEEKRERQRSNSHECPHVWRETGAIELEISFQHRHLADSYFSLYHSKWEELKKDNCAIRGVTNLHDQQRPNKC